MLNRNEQIQSNFTLEYMKQPQFYHPCMPLQCDSFYDGIRGDIHVSIALLEALIHNYIETIDK